MPRWIDSEPQTDQPYKVGDRVQTTFQGLWSRPYLYTGTVKSIRHQTYRWDGGETWHQWNVELTDCVCRGKPMPDCFTSTDNLFLATGKWVHHASRSRLASMLQ